MHVDEVLIYLVFIWAEFARALSIEEWDLSKLFKSSVHGNTNFNSLFRLLFISNLSFALFEFINKSTLRGFWFEALIFWLSLNAPFSIWEEVDDYLPSFKQLVLTCFKSSLLIQYIQSIQEALRMLLTIELHDPISLIVLCILYWLHLPCWLKRAIHILRSSKHFCYPLD